MITDNLALVTLPPKLFKGTVAEGQTDFISFINVEGNAVATLSKNIFNGCHANYIEIRSNSKLTAIEEGAFNEATVRGRIFIEKNNKLEAIGYGVFKGLTFKGDL